jgi:hypothetical protein
MWFALPERNTLRLRENGVVLFKSSLTHVSLNLFFLTDLSIDRLTYPSTHVKWCLPEPFIVQGRIVTMSPKA